MTEDDLTPEERDALARLPREAEPPPELEDRVAAELRRRGLLRSRRRGWIAGRLAAAVVLFAAGLGAGAVLFRGTPPVASSGLGADSFLLLLYPGPGFVPAGAQERAARVEEYSAWARGLRRDGRLLAAERLGEGRRILGRHDPAAAPEAPLGFFLVTAASFDQAAEIAGSCPHLLHGGQVAVQPVAPTRRAE